MKTGRWLQMYCDYRKGPQKDWSLGRGSSSAVAVSKPSVQTKLEVQNDSRGQIGNKAHEAPWRAHAPPYRGSSKSVYSYYCHRDGGSKFSSLLNFQVKPNLYFYYEVIYFFFYWGTIQFICILGWFKYWWGQGGSTHCPSRKSVIHPMVSVISFLPGISLNPSTLWPEVKGTDINKIWFWKMKSKIML